MIARGAVIESLKARTPVFLFGHDMNRPIGKFIEVVDRKA
jgi:hypothetical protein